MGPRTRTRPTRDNFITQEQFEVILEKLSGIEAGQKDLAKAQDTITIGLAKREHIDTKVLEMDKTLTGNGKWGFVKLRDWAMNVDDENKYYRRLAITMFITNLITLAATAFVWLAKIYPALENLQKAGL